MNANLVTDAKLALVIAEGKPPLVPNMNDRAPTQWQFFVAKVGELGTPPAGTLTIHENVWLIPLANGLPFATKLIEWAQSYSVSIRILFLTEVPVWIKYPPDAEEKPSQATP
jgi:hypothetical protein